MTRTFSKTAASPGEDIRVNLTVSITAGEAYYAIDETYPSGWIVMSTAGDTNQSGHVKFIVIQNAVSTNHTYLIRAPAQQGVHTFSGLYMFEYMASEANVSGQTQVTVTSSDSTPPSISFYPPTPSNNSDVLINYIYANVLLSENPGSCLLNWYNGTWTNLTMTISGLNCYRNMTGLANYTYQFRVYAADLAGNMNVTPGMRQNRVSYSPPDITPPSITFVAPTPNNNTNATGNYIPVNVSLSENPGSCLLNWYNGTWTNLTMTVSGANCYRNMTGLLNYVYQFRVYASDAAGNMNVSAMRQNRISVSQNITFVIPPTPANNTIVPQNYIPVNVSLSTAPGTCLLNWYNGTWVNFTMSISGRYCFVNMTALVNYTYQFRVYATDQTGNLNVSATRQNTLAYSPPDTVPPTIQITSPTSNPTYSTNQPTLNISGTASDNAGVAQVNWSNNRGGSGIAAGTTSWSVTGITLYTGENNISVIARDAAGNTGTDLFTVNYTQACADADGDGYGNPASPLCAHPELDCNESNSSVHPGAAEICGNIIDDNCNGQIDEGCGSGSIIVTTNYYDGSTTNFSAVNLANNVTGMILEKLNAGKIAFREDVKFTQSISLDSQSNISFNRVYMNSSAFPMLNKSATVHIYNLTFINPIIQMDGSECLSGECIRISYSGGALIFNVTHFTEYSAMEGPYCGDGSCGSGENCSSCQQDCGTCIFCGNGICDSGESCGSCSQDCGQCPAPPPGGGGGGGGGGGDGGLACFAGQTRACSISHKGACAAGTETCANGNWTGCPKPSNEICNRIDDNCDGTADNGIICECFIGEARPCGSNVGECRNGTRQCGSGAWGECAGETKPSAEVCDGKDNNCDGQIDEDCMPAGEISDCQDGLIPESGCRCGDKTYKIGYCFSGIYSETGSQEFPWITLTIFGIIIFLLLTAAIIYLKFYKKGKSDVTWDDLVKKYKEAILPHG